MGKVTDNLHLIDGISYSNVFLVIGKDLTLIDTGMPKNDKKILEYISNLGFSTNNLKKIIITHYHPDHIGSLFEVWSKTNATIYVHENDADYILGRKKIPFPKGFMGLFYRLLSPFMKLKFVNEVKKINEGDVIENLKVIHTPGHTGGHICLYNPREKILFSADMFKVEKGKIVPISKSFVEDEDELKKSLHKISKLNFNIICPGHGEVVKSGGKMLLEDFL